MEVVGNIPMCRSRCASTDGASGAGSRGDRPGSTPYLRGAASFSATSAPSTGATVPDALRARVQRVAAAARRPAARRASRRLRRRSRAQRAQGERRAVAPRLAPQREAGSTTRATLILDRPGLSRTAEAPTPTPTPTPMHRRAVRDPASRHTGAARTRTSTARPAPSRLQRREAPDGRVKPPPGRSPRSPPAVSCTAGRGRCSRARESAVQARTHGRLPRPLHLHVGARALR